MSGSTTKNDRNAEARVLEYWFGTLDDEWSIPMSRASIWFARSDETDDHIRTAFGADRECAVRGELQTWESSPRARLALIILVDQFSRNIFRGEPEAFAHDGLARRWCLDGLALGHDRSLAAVERVFFYLPLEHAEDLALQHRSVELYEALLATAPDKARGFLANCLDYAQKHREIIQRFGGFPHRNETLGRASTPEESAFLAQPGSSF